MTISLAGRVVDDTGVGLNNATVQAYVWGQTSVAPNGSTVTANDAQGLPGYWSLPNLADALYVVQVSYFGKTRTTYGPSQVQFNEIVIGANKALIDNNGNLTLGGYLTVTGQTTAKAGVVLPNTQQILGIDTSGGQHSLLGIGSDNWGGLYSPKLGIHLFKSDGATVLGNIYDSGGVYIGTAPTDPGANNLYVQGTARVENGTILKAQASVGTTDLGLYSGGATNAIRLVTNGGDIRLFKDGGAGTNPSLTVSGNSGGVYIGTTPTDPGVNNLTVQSDIYLGARSAWLSTWLNQALKTTDGPTFAQVTVTGLGALSGGVLNQNVKTTDSPTFSGLTTGNISNSGTISKVSGCRVYYGISFPATVGAWTALNWSASRWNVGSVWSGTGSQMKPSVAGVYHVGGSINFGASGSGTIRGVAVRLNGAAFYAQQANPPINSTTFGNTLSAEALIYMNGSTDYAEVCYYTDVALTMPGTQGGNSNFGAEGWCVLVGNNA